MTMIDSQCFQEVTDDKLYSGSTQILNASLLHEVSEKPMVLGIENASKNSVRYHSSLFKSIKISQVSRFNDSYFRNNKQNTEKTIRCFPSCSPHGHQRYGNCCSDITATCDFTYIDVDGKGYGHWDDLLVYGEFSPENEGTRYNPNTVLSEDVLHRIVISDQTRVEAGHTLMRAKLTLLSEREMPNKMKMARVIMTIRPPMGGFCYAWKSNRWVAETRHCIEYTIFERTDLNNTRSPLRVVAAYKPRGNGECTFRIVSTRTNYNHTKAERIEEEKIEVSNILCLLNNKSDDEEKR